MVEKFFGSTDHVTTTPDGQRVVFHVDGTSHQLSRAAAVELRDELDRVLTEQTEFFRTVGEHREDGSYVVSRRGANSSGHRKVFESFGHLQRLYDRLPEEFTAEDVGRSGLTGGRRHMVLHHVVEHPSFGCELVSRQPLTVRKAAARADDEALTTDLKEVVLTGD